MHTMCASTRFVCNITYYVCNTCHIACDTIDTDRLGGWRSAKIALHLLWLPHFVLEAPNWCLLCAREQSQARLTVVIFFVGPRLGPTINQQLGASIFDCLTVPFHLNIHVQWCPLTATILINKRCTAWTLGWMNQIITAARYLLGVS